MSYTDEQRASWLKMHRYLMTIPQPMRDKVILELKRRQRVDRENAAREKLMAEKVAARVEWRKNNP